MDANVEKVNPMGSVDVQKMNILEAMTLLSFSIPSDYSLLFPWVLQFTTTYCLKVRRDEPTAFVASGFLLRQLGRSMSSSLPFV